MFSSLFRRNTPRQEVPAVSLKSAKPVDKSSKPNQKRLYGPDIQFDDRNSNASGEIDNELLNNWINNKSDQQQTPSSTLKLECNLKRNSLRILTNDKATSIKSTESDRPVSPSMSIAPISSQSQSLRFICDSTSPKVRVLLTWTDSEQPFLDQLIDGGWDKMWQSPSKLDLIAHEQKLTKSEDSETDSTSSNDLKKVELKLRIDLVCSDVNGAPISPLNKQSTYLNIHRCDECWLLRVDKRVANIGSNLYDLHEIYGLSSHTKENNDDVNQVIVDDHVGGECVICLASARDTLLLPCRHLVACKDCATRMTDFGSGAQTERDGGIWGTENNEPTTLNSNENDRVIAAEAGNNNNNNETHTRPSRRRKRKPKGWYCPVCRQPYTAMLRVAYKD
ncbi:hypothetical protein E3Q14_00399 [Wallemia mellicola]|nr:hypothetical protein E3Q14_00399 [Wallemia mellicola]